MKLAKVQLPSGEVAVALVEDDEFALLPLAPAVNSLAALLDAPSRDSLISECRSKAVRRLKQEQLVVLPPIDHQEVWAAGVTYRRSQVARMEESQGAASFYDKVYAAQRPELFFKATPHRVSGPGQPLRIRRDAAWNVPEPELVLVLNSRLELVGFCVGNDMSSRDIEGENPLYLPQAKVYDACCGLGPWITLKEFMPAVSQIGIHMSVRRENQVVFSGSTSAGQIARSFKDLVGWLGRENSFPQGVFLLTGTGIVPGDEFTLQPGDIVEITIDGIGTLSNPIVRGAG